MTKKQFALRGDQIQPLAENFGCCIATDLIVVHGRKVGYMYRSEPRNELDSGWAFMAGDESQAYMDDAANHGIYDVNTIANYDPDVIPFLEAPVNTAFERQSPYGRFSQIKGVPWEPRPTQTASTKRWPPPGYPIVEGDHSLPMSWTLQLPQKFARRVEDESIVLWRPGLTIWIAVWDFNQDNSQALRLERIKASASPLRFGEHEDHAQELIRYCYRLREENDDAPVESLYGFVLSENSQLEMAIYFDDLEDEAEARQLVASVTHLPRTTLS